MKETKPSLFLRFYANEPCRICGEPIKLEDLREAVFTGYSIDNKSRSAHGPCWKKRKPQSEWAYPVSEKE